MTPPVADPRTFRSAHCALGNHHRCKGGACTCSCRHFHLLSPSPAPSDHPPGPGVERGEGAIRAKQRGK